TAMPLFSGPGYSDVPDSTGWQLMGTADFNNDGNTDLLWHNGATGDVVVWFLNGTTVTNGVYVTSGGANVNLPASAGWEIVSR
ncbi:MAG TPA: hypothetical protein VKT80_11740, partial [Chloroflexota bacterium]|nr:hypothetical protein [Chloroflexota bacterium]